MAAQESGSSGWGAGAGIVHRPRLLARLDHPVLQMVVVVAPSGYGKTTLLREWSAGVDADRLVLWVPLIRPLRAVDDFWQALLASAARFGLVADPEVPRGRLRDGGDPVEVLGEVLGSTDRPVVLVVDGYEQAEAVLDRVDPVLAGLVAADPLLRIVIATRHSGFLDSVAGQLRHGVDVIDDQALAFTRDETARLLQAQSSVADVDVVQRITGGYPLAVRAVALSHTAVGGAHREPSAWRGLVAEMLLGSLDADLRDFVATTCVPPYLDLDLASRLTGVADPEPAIAAVERLGLGRWIPFGPGRPVFQYADAVRDVVRDVARTEEPDAFRAACAAAAQWLHELGEDVLALQLAIDGREFELASDIYAVLVVRNPDSYTSTLTEEFLSRLAAEDLARHPVLAFARGLACLTATSTRAAAPDFLAIAAEAVTDPASGLPIPTLTMHHNMRMISERLLGRFADSAASARAALAWFDEVVVHHSGNANDFRPAMLRHISYSLFQAGDLELAGQVSARAIAAAALPVSRNQTAAHAAGIAAIDGRTRDAEGAAAIVDPGAWPPGQDRTYVNALGRIGTAARLLDEFRFEEALATYDDCSFVDTSEFWPFITWTRLLAAQGLGDAEAEALRVEELLRRGQPGVGANLGTVAVRNALAVGWLAAGRQAKAAALLAGRVPCPGQLAPAVLLNRMLAGDAPGTVAALAGVDELPGHTVRSRGAVASIGAAAALRSGNDGLAATLLERAAALWETHGARAHLVWLPDDDLDALAIVVKERGGRQSCGYLEGAPSGQRYGAVVELSPREREVLAAIARHGSREEVAAVLHVSVNTVKAHLKTAYRKLGATTRDRAVERAIELDLLTPEPPGA